MWWIFFVLLTLLPAGVGALVITFIRAAAPE